MPVTATYTYYRSAAEAPRTAVRLLQPGRTTVWINADEPHLAGGDYAVSITVEVTARRIRLVVADSLEVPRDTGAYGPIRSAVVRSLPAGSGAAGSGIVVARAGRAAARETRAPGPMTSSPCG